MSLRYLLDTNVLSEPLRPAPAASVLERLRAHSDELATATVVWHDLRFGVRRLPAGGRRLTLQRYLDEVILPTTPILPYDVQAADWHPAERARLTAIGEPQPVPDGMVAAVAHVNRLFLVTRNLTDFESFDGLEVESWHE